MTRNLPEYGPTSPLPCGADGEPFAVVRMALTLTRAQMRAALAIGHAEQQGEPSLDEMSAADIRREVEGYFGAAAVLGSEGLVERVNASLGARLVADLDTALDRAYPRRSEPPQPQAPQYGDGTVTLTTLDRGRVTVDEPAWCTGHDGEQVVDYVDLTHVGTAVAGEYAGVEFLPARISWGPFAELRPEPFPLADVDEFPGMSPDELRELAAEVIAQGGRLYSKANELDRIRRGMQ